MALASMLGILDWGIGGLDLFRKLRAAGCTCDVLYWSDAGSPPYGTLSADALAQRVASVADRLATRGCDRVIVACNAASTVLSDPAIAEVGARRGCEVQGVIEPAVAAVLARALPSITVIGGRRTIEAQAHARPLTAGGCLVRSRVAQPLSGLIERGVTDGAQLDACLAEILEPVADTRHLLIGCTHYVAALPAIERRLPQLQTIIDPAAETLAQLRRRDGLRPGRGHERFVTTGRPRDTLYGAAQAFGLDLPAVERVALDL